MVVLTVLGEKKISFSISSQSLKKIAVKQHLTYFRIMEDDYADTQYLIRSSVLKVIMVTTKVSWVEESYRFQSNIHIKLKAYNMINFPLKHTHRQVSFFLSFFNLEGLNIKATVHD